MEHMSLAVGAHFLVVSGSYSFFSDNEFTQLMKGLQGERLRQAFRYLDSDQDGFIRPEEFKQIIMVNAPSLRRVPR